MRERERTFRVTSPTRGLLWQRWGRRKKGYIDVSACSECAVPRATRACAASSRGGHEGRFSDCLAVKDMYRHTKQKRTTLFVVL